MYTITNENPNQEEQEFEIVNFIDDVLVEVEKFDQATIKNPVWGEGYIATGIEDRGTDWCYWAAVRYFPGSDQHGNGGQIPDDAQAIIQRVLVIR